MDNVYLVAEIGGDATTLTIGLDDGTRIVMKDDVAVCIRQGSRIGSVLSLRAASVEVHRPTGVARGGDWTIALQIFD